MTTLRKNHIKIGPVIIRIGSKHLAPWGFPRLRVGGLSIWTWTNDGQLGLASYHPKSSITWLWSLWIDPRRPWRWNLHRQERMPRSATDMERAMKAIQAVEANAPNAAAARERLMEIVVEAKYRADHVSESK